VALCVTVTLWLWVWLWRRFASAESCTFLLVVWPAVSRHFGAWLLSRVVQCARVSWFLYPSPPPFTFWGTYIAHIFLVAYIFDKEISAEDVVMVTRAVFCRGWDKIWSSITHLRYIFPPVRNIYQSRDILLIFYRDDDDDDDGGCCNIRSDFHKTAIFSTQCDGRR